MRRSHYIAISLVVLLLDQISKLLVVSRLSEMTAIPVIPGFFRLVRVENRGIAFGMFSDSSSSITGVVLVLLSVAAIGLVAALLWHNPPPAVVAGCGLALILGGAAGNLLDRLARGHVVDFLDFYVGSYHWPAFNVADSAICVGAGALLWDILIAHPARQRAA
ncbi:MAG TPA: signal peptidase II [Terriglobia bacterium]|nr:signal peptidase II [Terriglobia bacterium]